MAVAVGAGVGVAVASGVAVAAGAGVVSAAVGVASGAVVSSGDLEQEHRETKQIAARILFIFTFLGILPRLRYAALENARQYSGFAIRAR